MFTVALIVWMLFFVFARIIYSKFDKNYNRKKGEYSISNEREEIISYKSSVSAFKAMGFSLLFFLLDTFK